MTTETNTTPGPIVFAYDGSDLAKLAIDEASKLLDGQGREALVACVWQPFDLGFIPAGGFTFDAAAAEDVRTAAKATAEEGAARAEAAGFRAAAAEIESAPTWKGLVDLADSNDAQLIVLGSHGRHGLAEVFVGSVAGAVAEHSSRSVLIVHARKESETAT
jgi:nucleotide-binding universal stress UspA family protein